MDIRKDAVLIKEALDKGLRWIKPKPKIIIEENEYEDGVSVFIASKYFSGKKLYKMEDMVWDILKRSLPWETAQKVSMLFVLTPHEAKFWLKNLGKKKESALHHQVDEKAASMFL
ncbi:hypothetical protein FJZ31_09570 [Candidatus Poribacteria bacterium]|nr:hypothetical protein [Candidatus Poribacteria bacterium]